MKLFTQPRSFYAQSIGGFVLAISIISAGMPISTFAAMQPVTAPMTVVAPATVSSTGTTNTTGTTGTTMTTNTTGTTVTTTGGASATPTSPTAPATPTCPTSPTAPTSPTSVGSTGSTGVTTSTMSSPCTSTTGTGTGGGTTGGGTVGGGSTGGGTTGGTSTTTSATSTSPTNGDIRSGSGSSGGSGNGVIITGGTSGGSGSGQSANGSSIVPVGQVLGASTCGPLISTYMRIGWNNDTNDVANLQTFLNREVGSTLPVTGYYGALTAAAVNLFQVKYGEEVLAPWVPYGLPSAQTPTGYVYKTTQREVNLVYCPTLTIQQPTLP
jgi:hypothetical protein